MHQTGATVLNTDWGVCHSPCRKTSLSWQFSDSLVPFITGGHDNLSRGQGCSVGLIAFNYCIGATLVTLKKKKKEETSFLPAFTFYYVLFPAQKMHSCNWFWQACTAFLLFKYLIRLTYLSLVNKTHTAERLYVWHFNRLCRHRYGMVQESRKIPRFKILLQRIRIRFLTMLTCPLLWSKVSSECHEDFCCFFFFFIVPVRSQIWCQTARQDYVQILGNQSWHGVDIKNNVVEEGVKLKHVTLWCINLKLLLL